jgi:protein TonB
VKSWAISLALHGAALGLAALLWRPADTDAAPEVLSWTVAFVAAPAHAVPKARQTVPPTTRQNKVLPPPPARLPGPSADLPSPAESPPAIRPMAQAPVPVSSPQPLVARQADLPTASVATLAVAASPVQVPPQGSAPAPAKSAAVPESANDNAVNAERDWRLALLEQLHSLRRYPMLARRQGLEGVVLVEARIDQDGRLAGVEIKLGSGHPMLDAAALRLLEAAVEAARGQHRPERPARLTIPIAYKLDG